MATLTIQIDANTENGLRLLSTEEGHDVSAVAARLLARAVSLETPEVLKTFIGRVTTIDGDTACIDMRDADDDQPYAMQYDANTLLVLNIKTGDPVECKLIRRSGKTDVVFAAIPKRIMSAEERKQMHAELEAKYAQFSSSNSARINSRDVKICPNISESTELAHQRATSTLRRRSFGSIASSTRGANSRLISAAMY